MDKLAIVILNWNGERMLKEYLPSVLEYSKDEAVVYVADNASTDGSVKMIKDLFPQCKTIMLDENWGFAEGYNKALKQIEAQYFLLLNSDIEVTKGWLTPLIDFLDNTPEAAACQPKLMSIADRQKFEYAGAAGGYIDKYGYPFCRGRIFDTIEEDKGQYDQPVSVMWATGAALMIRSSDYWEAGGLDCRFFAHCEEIDLCWRLRIMGRTIACIPQSIVYHVGGGTLPKANPRKTFLNFRNNLTMIYKCASDDELAHVMRMRWWLDMLAAAQMLLLKRNWGDCKAVIKGRRAFMEWRYDFDADRKEIQAKRTLKQIPEQMNGSLLWQYYVKGKKWFASLPLPDFNLKR